MGLDVALFWWLHRTFSGGWLLPMAIASAVGGGWGSLLAVPLYFSKKTRKMAAVLTAVLVANAVLVFVLKRIIGRRRPWQVLTDVHALVFDAPVDFSFPSGHAAGSFAFCVFFAVVLTRVPSWPRRFAAVGLVLLACLVALSRVALGVHFLGDVTAGALLGTFSGVLGARVYLQKYA